MVASMASKREYFEEMFQKLSGTLLDLTTIRQLAHQGTPGISLDIGTQFEDLIQHSVVNGPGQNTHCHDPGPDDVWLNPQAHRFFYRVPMSG